MVRLNAADEIDIRLCRIGGENTTLYAFDCISNLINVQDPYDNMMRDQSTH